MEWNTSRNIPVESLFQLLCVMSFLMNQKTAKGHTLSFGLTKQVFATAIQFDYRTIAGRIRELAFLNPKYTCFQMMMLEDCSCQTMECYLACCGIIKAQWLVIQQ
ncbi:hypothetical protein LOK49_LG05G01079 [Camellia lanceoleosa]|uniref:Uncharacterized protein n=1 Tax=Camellia lanceoleosa TaxID=1840588 RepID=A0ACC0HUR0_9ERIC|nr:hypothetical protein LOK49_LG05G01079 [Camellia lanceoleosa]